jgi:hypothetical protein
MCKMANVAEDDDIFDVLIVRSSVNIASAAAALLNLYVSPKNLSESTVFWIRSYFLLVRPQYGAYARYLGAE